MLITLTCGSSTAYSLQGEKPLSEKSVERSSNAYDKHLLSKIGKPSSGPRQSFSLSNLVESDSNSTTLPSHTRQSISLSTLSIGDGPQRWNNGPPSAAISPGTRPGWSDYLSHRTPGTDSPGVSPMDIDPATNHARQFGFSGTRGIEETASLPSRSNRGSYDQANFIDSDTDFPMEDTTVSGQVRRRGSARDTAGPYAEGYSPLSRQGMKRRASSPPRASALEEANALHHIAHPQSTMSSGELEHQRRSSGFPFNENISPSSRYQPSHGSMSSVSSASLRTGSYASSTGLSAGASSMSSYDRPSPGGISPTSDMECGYDKGCIVSPGTSQRSPNSTLPSASARLPPPYYESSADSKGGTSSLRRVPSATQSSGGSGGVSKTSAPRIGSLHICDCCPKKPKKFDTAEELR